jgi:hypothetical protein
MGSRFVLGAPSPDDRKLQEQPEAVAATRSKFQERDMALVVLLDDAASTACRCGNGR